MLPRYAMQNDRGKGKGDIDARRECQSSMSVYESKVIEIDSNVSCEVEVEVVEEFIA